MVLGYLYAARMCVPNYEACPIKIGYTQDPQGRCRSLKGSLPFPLEWYGAWPAKKARSSEAKVFEMFAAYRLGGEWFYPSTEIIQYVQTQIANYQELVESWKDQKRATRVRAPKDAGTWLKWAEVSGYDEFAESFETVHRAERGLCLKCTAPISTEAVEKDAEARRIRCEAAITASGTFVFTPESAQIALELDTATFDSYVRKGAISGFRWSQRGPLRFRPRDLLAFMDSGWEAAHYGQPAQLRAAG